MARLEPWEEHQWIDINVPMIIAYNQLSNYEQFPHFIPEVESVRQSGQQISWIGQVEGIRREWIMQITSQIPHQQITWHSEAERFSTHISFEQLEPSRTRVKIRGVSA